MNNGNGNELNNSGNYVENNVVKNDFKSRMLIYILFAIVTICFIYFFIAEGLIKIQGLNDNPSDSKNEASEFLALANKYASEVEKLWTSDSMLCQDSINPNNYLKPSKLSSKDKYEGPALYYVFINTLDSSEIKLDVDSDKDVAGWVRINKETNSFYVALSDGTNYILDKGNQRGAEFGTPYNSLKEKDVITTGNGANYQYFNGEIFGSSTDGNGWGIGDYKVLSDDDKSNDGIYMSNGKKTGGYTPFCKNIN